MNEQMKELVAIAQDRKYSEFETKALEAITQKFMSSETLKDSLGKLAIAKGQAVSEAKDENKSKDGDEYKAFFASKLKKYNVDSPEDLEGEAKTKFYDEVDREWKADDE